MVQDGQQIQGSRPKNRKGRGRKTAAGKRVPKTHEKVRGKKGTGIIDKKGGRRTNPKGSYSSAPKEIKWKNER